VEGDENATDFEEAHTPTHRHTHPHTYTHTYTNTHTHTHTHARTHSDCLAQCPRHPFTCRFADMWDSFADIRAKALWQDEPRYQI